jgi:hypothetical protein
MPITTRVGSTEILLYSGIQGQMEGQSREQKAGWRKVIILSHLEWERKTLVQDAISA